MITPGSQKEIEFVEYLKEKYSKPPFTKKPTDSSKKENESPKP